MPKSRHTAYIRQKVEESIVIIDSHIVEDYIAGKDLNQYKSHWIYNCFGERSVFELPDPKNREWVSKLFRKISDQIKHFTPRNGELVRRIFPQFDRISNDYTILLVVGFPDPYDAMVLERDGKAYMVFDLIQFQEDSLNEDYSCHRVLTHELIHLCLMEEYPAPHEMSYIEDLNYTAFNEGFAHALTYPEDIESFTFDAFLKEKFEAAKHTLQAALAETDKSKQQVYSRMADTGEYWDKFAAMAGKLYLLRHIADLEQIYRAGWHDFAARILND